MTTSQAAKNPQNRLGYEKSPYLLQHADNPVDWYAWGPEAFEKARKEDKPIFLSIGYSTCHWCHVMEHESFEDPQVAKLMNDVFVSIKVDREERPDIDGVYMTICQMTTGGGGWPLTIIMTPDKKPFFAATYIPKDSRFGHIGMTELIPWIHTIWTTRRSELDASAAKITATLEDASRSQPGDNLDETVLRQAYDELAGRFDPQHGGFGSAPKFPTPHNLSFLLRYWKRTGDKHALDMVEKTLGSMRLGGMYDQVGFGFHRYSTDETWLVPHFEKMLYDQALLAVAYIEAYQATGKITYADTARELFTYVLRDMTSPEGGFYSAEDADSEGKEGKFYLWTESEIHRVLDETEAKTFIRHFNVSKEGNFVDQASGGRTGENILHLTPPIDEPVIKGQLAGARARLFAEREKRVHPHKDDKILTDWNGLMIAALAKGAQALDEPKYAEAAKRAADFLLKTMLQSDGRLLHRYRDGQAAVMGNLDDYAFLTHGLIELYEVTFDVIYLQAARDLTDELLKHFWDAPAGGFYFTADDAEGLLVRQKEIYDGALPSGNSLAMLNLLRLGRITADADFDSKASALGRMFSGTVRRMPSAYTQLMAAVDFAVGPSYEVVIAGKRQAADTQAMFKALRSAFAPNKVVLHRPTDEDQPPIIRLSPFTEHQTGMNGRATAYICLNFQCKQPTTSVDEMLALLNGK